MTQNDAYYLVQRGTNTRVLNRDGSALKVEEEYIHEEVRRWETRLGTDLVPMTITEYRTKWETTA